VRVTVAFTVGAADVADALAIGWDAFRAAAADDLSGWEVTAASAEIQPDPRLPGAGAHGPAAARPAAEAGGTELAVARLSARPPVVGPCPGLVTRLP
jgi:hypothetical protein